MTSPIAASLPMFLAVPTIPEPVPSAQPDLSIEKPNFRKVTYRMCLSGDKNICDVYATVLNLIKRRLVANVSFYVCGGLMFEQTARAPTKRLAMLAFEMIY
jgi:hypothetical protein